MEVDLTFKTPCVKLTEVYNKLKARGDKKAINKAIFVFEVIGL